MSEVSRANCRVIIKSKQILANQIMPGWYWVCWFSRFGLELILIDAISGISVVFHLRLRSMQFSLNGASREGDMDAMTIMVLFRLHQQWVERWPCCVGLSRCNYRNRNGDNLTVTEAEEKITTKRRDIVKRTIHSLWGRYPESIFENLARMRCTREICHGPFSARSQRTASWEV